MNILGRLSEAVYDRFEKKTRDKIRSGLTALHIDNQWTSGSFIVKTSQGNVRIFLEKEREGEQASVYAENQKQSQSRSWSIPDAELESGLESTTGAIFDVLYGDYQ